MKRVEGKQVKDGQPCYKWSFLQSYVYMMLSSMHCVSFKTFELPQLVD